MLKFFNIFKIYAAIVLLRWSICLINGSFTKNYNMRKKMLMSVCAFAMAILSSFGQTSTITGKVIDDKGAPIVGATVIEKGAKNGTSAGADGSFSLKVKKGATLIVSALGFEDKQIASTSTNLLVQLTTDVRSLSEVVVTGVGVATSKKRTGCVCRGC